MAFIRDTGFRSVGSLTVFACLVSWHIGVFLLCVAHRMYDLGFQFCRFALFTAIALIPITFVWSLARHLGRQRAPIDYHGPFLSILAAGVMIGEGYLVMMFAFWGN